MICNIQRLYWTIFISFCVLWLIFVWQKNREYENAINDLSEAQSQTIVFKTKEVSLSQILGFQALGIREYDLMDKIAWCESGNQQFNPDGSVLRGRINSHDIGKFQINETYWGIKAKELGYDIFIEEENEAMAIWLFKNYGTKPWNWSKSCWQ